MTKVLVKVGAMLTGVVTPNVYPCQMTVKCHTSTCGAVTEACSTRTMKTFDLCDSHTYEYCDGPFYSCC
ncbi:MAG TPA: hypothetical protein VK464_13910 [Symbiobacteriaceae bacterium]|nr:hypothetical protein [Symbiobacteriaceae bacterium]